jgi:hypothetical protein
LNFEDPDGLSGYGKNSKSTPFKNHLCKKVGIFSQNSEQFLAGIEGAIICQTRIDSEAPSACYKNYIVGR